MNPSGKKCKQRDAVAAVTLLSQAWAPVGLPAFSPPRLPCTRGPAFNQAVAGATSFLSRQDGGRRGWSDSGATASFSPGSCHFGKVSLWEDAE